MADRWLEKALDEAPGITVKAELKEAGLRADVFILTIEQVRYSHRTGDGDYSCRLGLENGDNTVGVHQRALSNFSLRDKTAIDLVHAALSLFVKELE